jgi:hypothetical protein
MSLFSTAAGKLYSLPVSGVPAAGAAPAGVPPPTPAPAAHGEEVAEAAAEETKGDTSLPDPTARARTVSLILSVLAVVAALLINALDLTAKAFEPAKIKDANFALFAGFYVAALLIERACELIAPHVPTWDPPKNAPPAPGTTEPGPALDGDARTAHVKADRGMIMLGVSFLFAVLLAGLLGLYFMTAIGMKVSPTVDTILTGLVIAGGTKKLHDFMSLIQNRSNPKSGTGAT